MDSFSQLCRARADHFHARLGQNNDPDTCWNWPGSDDGRSGYGRFKIRSNWSAATHRIAYTLAFGPIPDGMDVCHKCDNPRCCNPAHLFIGDHRENMADMARKRRARGPVLKGEKNPRAILGLAAVLEIKRLIASGAKTRSLARQYGVTDSMISRIKHGKAWI